MRKQGAKNRHVGKMKINDGWIEMRTSSVTEVAINGVLEGTSRGK